MSTDEVEFKSQNVWRNLKIFDLFQRANNVSIYMSFNNEVTTPFMIDQSMEIGKKIFLPKIIKENVYLNIYKKNDFLEKGAYGIYEPESAPMNDDFVYEIDLWLIPGVVFDLFGNRIGFGKGYYDKLLQKTDMSKRVGLCYDFQVVDKIPVSEWDQKMGWIITESKIIKCH